MNLYIDIKQIINILSPLHFRGYSTSESLWVSLFETLFCSTSTPSSAACRALFLLNRKSRLRRFTGIEVVKWPKTRVREKGPTFELDRQFFKKARKKISLAFLVPRLLQKTLSPPDIRARYPPYVLFSLWWWPNIDDSERKQHQRAQWFPSLPS